MECQPDYGAVQWDVTGDQLVLHVTADEGVAWSALRVCVPYGLPNQHADCKPSDDSLLGTASYSVEVKAPEGAVASGSGGQEYTFEACASESVVTVPLSAVGGDASDFWWGMHLAPGSGEGCGGVGAGQTHEAFGRVI